MISFVRSLSNVIFCDVSRNFVSLRHEQGKTGRKYFPNYQFQLTWLRVYWINSKPRFHIFDAHQAQGRYKIKTRYKCCAQHNGRVANYCHVPLVIRRVHITSTPQAIHLLALCGEVINIHLRTKKDRSRSSIFELEIHPWYKFGINATNIDGVTCLSCL